MTEKTVTTETVEVTGDELLAKVKEIVREGNVRRIIIRDEEGKKLLELPLTIGVVGAVLLPVWAAVGALAALIADCTIEIEKIEDAEAESEEPGDDKELVSSFSD